MKDEVRSTNDEVRTTKGEAGRSKGQRYPGGSVGGTGAAEDRYGRRGCHSVQATDNVGGTGAKDPAKPKRRWEPQTPHRRRPVRAGG